MNKHLHIVSFDIPYPADYGGVMEVYYKIQTLHKMKIAVHLHCFEYGRAHIEELNKICASVHYYERVQGHKGFSLKYPYIVSSRSDDTLWDRLNADEYPVLLEGVHCTFGLVSGKLKKKNVAIRLHNVEFEYYNQLAQWENSLVRKAYMHNESRLLKRYEEQLKDYTILALNEKDAKKYRKEFKARHVEFVPAFIKNQMVCSKEGQGTFALYHGNLSVAENEKAATWLLEKVFHELEVPFVVAGKNPSKHLIELAHKYQHTCIVENPSEAEMSDLISKAQVHVLPSFTNSGIKLKLLNAIFNGRHVVANDEMVNGTGVEKVCHIANNATFFKYTILRLFHLPFTEEEKETRQGLLLHDFNNEKNAEKLMQLLH